MNTKLILVDGMPGSGKSTTGKLISERLNQLNVPNRFFHELEDNHPLRIYERQFTSFDIKEEADWFTEKVTKLFGDFVLERLENNQVTIMESYVFQNTIGFAYNMQMEPKRIMDLSKTIQKILSRLKPVLIVEKWDIPKLIIKNIDHQWEEYRERIYLFLNQLENDSNTS